MDIGAPAIAATATVSGHLLANTKRALLLSENTYKPVIYFPREDVDLTKLSKSKTTSRCPFKGTATYWHLSKRPENALDTIDICWSYEEPFKEAATIEGYIAFYSDKVTVTYCQ